MFIKQASISNIRSHKQTVLNLERISLIKGKNGSGGAGGARAGVGGAGAGAWCRIRVGY